MRMIPTIYKQEGDGGDNNLRMGGDAKVQINNFLMDNIFLACLFACAALLYKKVFIPMFANDVKRR